MKIATDSVVLDSLSLESSLKLIANEISRSDQKDNHSIHTAPARDYWKRYLFDLGAVLTQETQFNENDWEKVSDFLGYPPVICAIAPTLSSSNYLQSSQDLMQHRGSLNARSAVLTRIVEDLLRRETDKVQRSLAEAFEGKLNQNQIRSLYNYEEQVARILDLLGISSAESLPIGLPEEYRSQYEACLESFVDDHPFLDAQNPPRPRNIVFSDHLRAIVNSQTSYISGTSNKPVKSDKLLAVGPFYVHFMHNLLSRHHDSSALSDLHFPQIRNEEYVQDVITSWNSGVQSESTPLIQYSHRENLSALLDLQLERGLGTDPNRKQSIDIVPSLTFEIADPDGLLQLDSPITNTYVMTDHGLYINASGGSITFGPNASIFARNIESAGVDEISFRSSSNNEKKGEFGFFLFTEEIRISGDYRIRKLGSGAVAIMTPLIDPRWRPFQAPVSQLDGVDRGRVLESVMYIRRILTCFRTMSGSPALHIDKFNRHVIGRNEMMRRIALSMTRANLIRESNGMMHLNSNELANLGVSYDTYSSPDWMNKLSAVLAKCMNSDETLQSFLSIRG